MEVRELRIGNWVNAIIHGRDIEYKIDSETLSSILLDEFWAIRPIPITEEWLIKFGFEKRESSICSEYSIGVNEITHDVLFYIAWLKEPEIINAPNAPFYRNGKHTLYYVHQLQNLYFALTGEELTLKSQ